jgi:hypothetical protein
MRNVLLSDDFQIFVQKNDSQDCHVVIFVVLSVCFTFYSKNYKRKKTLKNTTSV